MRYRLLGRSGLRVAEVALGTMTFGGEGAWGADPSEARRIYDRYLAAGGNFVDTADRYANGESERIVGELVAADRDRIVLGSKYTLTRRPGDPNASGNHRKSLVAALDASLSRLRTDYIDVYWVHAWDALTPIEEIVRALDDQVRAGKVHYVGFSNVPAWVVARADAIASLRGWTPFVALQTEYSLVQREPERELVPMARACDIGVLAWGPLGGGVLTGKYAGRTDGAEPRRLAAGDPRLSAPNLLLAAEVGAIGEEVGAPAASVAIAWLLHREGVTIPILGARRAAQLEDTLSSVALTLGGEHLDRLDSASRVDRGAPHDFLASPEFRDRIYGGTYDLIASHRPV